MNWWNGLTVWTRRIIIICVAVTIIALIATGQFMPVLELFIDQKK